MKSAHEELTNRQIVCYASSVLRTEQSRYDEEVEEDEEVINTKRLEDEDID